MANLSDIELFTLISSMESEAVTERSIRNKSNRESQRRYDGEPYGNEVEGRSSVISEDVKEVVESDMTGLVRTILGSGPIMKFKANNPNNEREVEEAIEKTAYVDWLVRSQPKSFRVNYGFLKDIEIKKMGVLKYFFEETEKTREQAFENISDLELQEVIDDIAATPFFDDFEVLEESTNEDGTFNLKFKVKTKKQEIILMGVPSHTFVISPGATDEDDAKLVGDITTITRGDLLAQGFKKKLISTLASVSVGNNSTSIRNFDLNSEGEIDPADFGEWAGQFVEFSDLYVMIDYDQDGIAERRHIVKSGQVILENEPYDHVPYAIASASLIPHVAVGEGRAEQVEKIAEINTALLRQTLDNIYMVGNPKLLVNENVNIDEALDEAIGGVVRVKGEGLLGNSIADLTIPFVGDKTLLVMQHMEQIKSKRVGTQAASQGLNADQLSKETATRFEGVRDAAAAKLELVTRIIAEVGYRKVYEGIAWTAANFQTTEREFSVLGKALTSNPSKWRFDHQIDSEIGLGAGDNTEIVANLQGLWQMQSQLKSEQSPLFDEDKRFNVADKLVKALELKNTSEFFNDPKEEDQLLKFENEQLNATVLQLQEQMQLLQQAADNPLAEAELVKREGDIAIAQGKLEIEAAKLAEDNRQFDVKALQEHRKQDESTALKLTELEIQAGKDLNAEMKDNMLVFDPATSLYNQLA